MFVQICLIIEMISNFQLYACFTWIVIFHLKFFILYLEQYYKDHQERPMMLKSLKKDSKILINRMRKQCGQIVWPSL